jgi:hypothetical protein
MQRQHPGGCGRDCQLEDDVGGVRGLGGFAEIILPTRRGAPRVAARRAATHAATEPTTGCHAGGCKFKWSDVSGYPQYPKAVRNFYDFFGFLNRNRVVITENGHC